MHPGLEASFDFAYLLRNIGLAAMDKLVLALRRNGSLPSARLACRGLRDALDSSIEDLSITIVTEDEEFCASRERPSLERWPRCKVLTVTVPEAAASAAGRGSAAALLLLPFSCLPPERRRRITHVTYVVRGLEHVEAAPLSALPLLLPSLQELSLHNVRLACDPQQLSLLHAALADLKQLQLLSLCGCHALEGIGALGSSGSSSLRHLEVWEDVENVTITHALQPTTLAGLSQLRGLQQINYVNFNPVTGQFNAQTCVAFLTASLPSSLQSLEFLVCRTLDSFYARIVVGVGEGKPRSVHVRTIQLLSEFIRLAAEVLLPGLPPAGQQQAQWPQWPPRQQPHLERLTVESLWIPYDYALGAAGVSAMTALRQRFRHVELGTLGLGECPDPQSYSSQLETAFLATQALATPGMLEVEYEACIFSGCTGLQCRYSGFSYPLLTSSAGQGARVYSPSTARAALAVDVLPAAVDRMVQFAAHAYSNGAPEAAAVRAGGSEVMELVLLRGPFVESLCRVPHAVGPWLGLLEGHIAASGAGCCSGSEPCGSCLSAGSVGNHMAKRIRAYQLLPSAGALLVACEERAKHALAAAAASEAAALYRRLQLGPGQQAGGEALEVVPLWVRWPWGQLDQHLSSATPLQDWLFYNMAMISESASADAYQDASAVHMRLALGCALLVQDEIRRKLPPAVVMQ